LLERERQLTREGAHTHARTHKRVWDDGQFWIVTTSCLHQSQNTAKAEYVEFLQRGAISTDRKRLRILENIQLEDRERDSGKILKLVLEVRRWEKLI
jgi:hypothetical protein